jgi:nardilysin
LASSFFNLQAHPLDRSTSSIEQRLSFRKIDRYIGKYATYRDSVMSSTTHAQPVLTDPAIVKPKVDKKRYETYTLPNGLQVLLVSTAEVRKGKAGDAGAKDASLKAAASMCVHVGSFADPEDCEGMAHFLEHMVFMGSLKYPKENHYDEHVAERGGYCNAFTEGEYTAYEFDVAAEFFDETLDIFGQCFMCPLLSMDSSEREIKAIQSEFVEAQCDDSSRIQQLFYSGCTEGHVLSKFSWGNMKSLKTTPEAKGVDVGGYMRKFFDTYYTPDNMSLVVIAPKTLEQLRSSVESVFGNWNCRLDLDSSAKDQAPKRKLDKKISPKNNHKKKFQKMKGTKMARTKTFQPVPAELSSLEGLIAPFRSKPLFSDEATMTLTRVVPSRNGHKLSITWQMPPGRALYRSNPYLYYAHLLGHEGPGGLLPHLKSKGLADEVSAGVYDGNFEDNSMFSLFTVSVAMPEKGVGNWPEVVAAVYDYIHMLRVAEPQEWIFREMQRVNESVFAYLDEEEESEFASRLSVEMTPYFGRRKEDLLAAPYLLWEWNPELIAGVLDYLTPPRGKVLIASSSFDPDAGSGGDKEEDGDDEDDSNEDESDEQDDSECDIDDDDDDDGDDEGDDDDSDDDNDEDEDDCEGVDPAVLRENFLNTYEGPKQWLPLIVPPHAQEKPREARKERFFGTLHWCDAIPKDLIDYWCASRTNAKVHLPPPNKFVPTDLSLIPSMAVAGKDQTSKHDEPETNGKHESTEADASAMIRSVAIESSTTTTETSSTPDLLYPAKIYSADGISIWHLTDTRFQMPKVDVHLRMTSQIVCESAHTAVMHDLWARMLQDALMETLYMSSLAEIDCSFKTSDESLQIRLQGFSSKADILCEEVLQAIKAPRKYLSQDAFVRQCECLDRIFENTALKSSNAAYYYRLLALKPRRINVKETKAALKDGTITLETTIAYAERFLSGMNVDVLAQGNIDATGARALLRPLIDAASSSSSPCESDSARIVLSSASIPKDHIVRIPPGPPGYKLIVVPGNPKEKNTCVEAYYQLGSFDLTHFTLLELLEDLLSEPFFNNLRTQQQLGYSVSCGRRDTYGVLGFAFKVLSSSKSAAEVQAAILTFIDNITTYLSEMPAEKFYNHVKVFSNTRQLPFTSLSEASEFNWAEINDRRDMFDINQRVSVLLLDRSIVSVESMVSFCESLFSAATRKLLVVTASVTASVTETKGAADASEVASFVEMKEPKELHAVDKKVP